MPRIRELVGQVLNSPELCTACTAIHSIKIDLALLDGLTPPTLQALRWHIQDEAKKEDDPATADFMRALDAYIEKGPLAVAKQRDERESYGMYKELSPKIETRPTK